MKRVCSYCNIDLGEADDSCTGAERISHGICRDCFEKAMRGLGEPLSDYLDSLQVPVFVVNGEAQVMFASKSAQEMVSKDNAQISGHLGGEVFECIHPHSIIDEIIENHPYERRLWDISDVDFDFSLEEIRAKAEYGKEKFVLPNRLAVYANADLVYGEMRQFAVYRKGDGKAVSNVFRDKLEAIEWLKSSDIEQ